MGWALGHDSAVLGAGAGWEWDGRMKCDAGTRGAEAASGRRPGPVRSDASFIEKMLSCFMLLLTLMKELYFLNRARVIDRVVSRDVT